MKRLLGLLIVVAFLVAIPVSHLVLAKGHVPAGMAQMCHKGQVIQIDEPGVRGHRVHGDCRIDAATLVPPLFTGDVCDAEALAAIGKCN